MKNHAVSVDGLFGNSEKLLSIGIGLLFKFNGCDGVEGLFDVFLDAVKLSFLGVYKVFFD